MALGASVYKVELDLSDTDRHVYLSETLRLACHPSETEQRMMVRLLAWCLNAAPGLQFGRGISTEDEPDLWELQPDGSIAHWVEVGQPSLERMKKARSRSAYQSVYTTGRGRDQWWPTVAAEFERFKHLSVYHLDDDEVAKLATFAEKSMKLSVCVTEGSAYFSSGEHTVTLTPLLPVRDQA